MEKISRYAKYIKKYSLTPMTFNDFLLLQQPLSVWKDAVNETEMGPQNVTFFDPISKKKVTTAWLYPDTMMVLSKNIVIVPKVVSKSESLRQLGILCTCGKPGNQRCGNCKHQRYCSKECQKNDWENHKKVCDFSKKCLSDGKDISQSPESIDAFLRFNYKHIMGHSFHNISVNSKNTDDRHTDIQKAVVFFDYFSNVLNHQVPSIVLQKIASDRIKSIKQRFCVTPEYINIAKRQWIVYQSKQTHYLTGLKLIELRKA